MSTEQNLIYLEEKQRMLVTAIQLGETAQANAIREELIESGLLSADQVEELSRYN
jgi:hypothetical protein